MSKILYFGNLPFTTSAADLTKLVKPFGEVISARIGLDKKTYKSRGFGFVEVPDNAVRAVIAGLHGTRFHGRELKVNEFSASSDPEGPVLEGQRPVGVRRDLRGLELPARPWTVDSIRPPKNTRPRRETIPPLRRSGLPLVRGISCRVP